MGFESEDEEDEEEEEEKWSNEDKDLMTPSVNLIKAAKVSTVAISILHLAFCTL